MFEGFADEMVDLGDVQLRVRLGGEGPPLLLIHGHPRTSATWHRVAPQLITAGFTVVCPDMRGYGWSSNPIIRDDHRQQAKRAVANDLAKLMSRLDLISLPSSDMIEAVMLPSVWRGTIRAGSPDL